jgi:hypothetical protein
VRPSISKPPKGHADTQFKWCTRIGSSSVRRSGRSNCDA